MKFVLKAGIIEAVQYQREENISEVQYFFDQAKDQVNQFRYQEFLGEYGIVVNGAMCILTKGDHIIRHIDGTYEVMDNDRFKKAYERVNGL